MIKLRRQESQRKRRDSGSRGQSDAITGLEGGRGPRAKGCRRLPEAGKGKGMDSPLELLEGMRSCRYLAFSP